jgi:Spy/CpxP family protein refolding chaperone
MKTNFLRIFGVAAIAGGLTFAQTTSPTPPADGQTQQGPGARRAQVRHRMAQRLSNYLNLTADQQSQAKQIFQASRQSAQPVAQQLREARKALAEAVKSNAPEAQIDQLSGNVGNLVSQLTAIRTKAFQKFYGTLSPDQKEKMNTAMGRFLGARGMRPAAFHGRATQNQGQVSQ